MYRVDVKVEPQRLKVLTYCWSGQTLAHLSVQIFGHVGFPGSWSKRKAGPCKVLSVTFKKFVRRCYVKQLIKKFLKIFFALIEFYKIMVQLCYSSIYLGIETVYCRLLKRMTRLEVDWNLKKLAANFFKLQYYACRIPQKVYTYLW